MDLSGCLSICVHVYVVIHFDMLMLLWCTLTVFSGEVTLIRLWWIIPERNILSSKTQHLRPMCHLLQSDILPLDGTKYIPNSWKCREWAEFYNIKLLFLWCLMHQDESSDGSWWFSCFADFFVPSTYNHQQCEVPVWTRFPFYFHILLSHRFFF